VYRYRCGHASPNQALGRNASALFKFAVSTSGYPVIPDTIKQAASNPLRRRPVSSFSVPPIGQCGESLVAGECNAPSAFGLRFRLILIAAD
ncbi:MAG: hypothetical protein Q8N47_16690, partial [Bryobacterales bacterium]|nr:hypothetical protein [Bryobacterales bacterium]